MVTQTLVTCHLRAHVDKKRHRQSLTVPKWRRRESNPQVQSRNSEVAKRLWNMLKDVGVSWEYTDDANHQPLALGHEELAEILWVYDGERLQQPISVANRLACPAVSPVRLIGVPFLAQSAAAASGTR